MAIFAPNFTAAEDINTGTSVLLTDISNWEDNTEGYDKEDFTRQFIIKDVYGEILDTLNLESVDSVEYDITGNQWLEITLNITGVEDYNKLLKFPFKRLYEIKLGEILENGLDDCNCTDGDFALCSALIYSDGAEFAAIAGDGPEFQENITAAYNTLLA